MTKELRKAIMTQSRLKSIVNRIRANENWTAYKRQRNLCVKILRQRKKTYNGQLKPKMVNESKTFWKAVKPLFSNKVQSSCSINLSENSIVESTESEVA